ncbi:hypothetical protein HY212_07425 [Candidatus Pacearchaeota archaeon]|nr:hypothetical protein [Candidatus Pacearchaeota archaeon]
MGTRALALEFNDERVKSKHSQVTLFIIIGIVVVAAAVLIFVFWDNLGFVNKEEKDISALSKEAIYVKSYVDNCFQESLKDTIFINALQGGYYKAPIELKNKQEDDNLSTYIHYYLIDKRNFIPSEKTLSDQISLGVNDQFRTCLNSSNFTYKVHYSLDDIKINSFIDDKMVKINVSFPISVSVGDSVSRLKEFNYGVKTDYLKFYKLSKEITEDQASHLDSVCISCFGDLSEDYKMKIANTELYDDSDYILIYNLGRAS